MSVDSFPSLTIGVSSASQSRYPFDLRYPVRRNTPWKVLVFSGGRWEVASIFVHTPGRKRLVCSPALGDVAQMRRLILLIAGEGQSIAIMAGDLGVCKPENLSTAGALPAVPYSPMMRGSAW